MTPGIKSEKHWPHMTPKQIIGYHAVLRWPLLANLLACWPQMSQEPVGPPVTPISNKNSCLPELTCATIMRVDLRWPCSERHISDWTQMTSNRKQGLWLTSNDALASNEGQADLKWQTKQLIGSQVYIKWPLGTEQRLHWPHMNPNRLSGWPQMNPGCLIGSQGDLNDCPSSKWEQCWP